MRADVVFRGVEVEKDGSGGDGYWVEKGQGITHGLYVHAAHVTELPEPIAEGTMVKAWGSCTGERPLYGRYVRAEKDGHHVRDVNGSVVYRDYVAPVSLTEEDTCHDG